MVEILPLLGRGLGRGFSPLGEGFGGEAFYFKNSTVRCGEYNSHNDAITQPGAKMSL